MSELGLIIFRSCFAAPLYFEVFTACGDIETLSFGGVGFDDESLAFCFDASAFFFCFLFGLSSSLLSSGTRFLPFAFVPSVCCLISGDGSTSDSTSSSSLELPCSPSTSAVSPSQRPSLLSSRLHVQIGRLTLELVLMNKLWTFSQPSLIC